jgi:hypothetical protein
MATSENHPNLVEKPGPEADYDNEVNSSDGLGPGLKEIRTAKVSRTSTRTPAISRTTTRRSQRSYFGGHDGYSCYSEDVPAADAENAGQLSDGDSFDVKWDGGDEDPLNPRHKSKLRKWVIVLILSSASLCVWVSSSKQQQPRLYR